MLNEKNEIYKFALECESHILKNKHELKKNSMF
jgi:hypothetical protein